MIMLCKVIASVLLGPVVLAVIFLTLAMCVGSSDEPMVDEMQAADRVSSDHDRVIESLMQDANRDVSRLAYALYFLERGDFYGARLLAESVLHSGRSEGARQTAALMIKRLDAAKAKARVAEQKAK